MNVYHVTWVTHSSRVSERMVTYKVKSGEPLLLDDELELEITGYIAAIVKENNLQVLAYNTCRDHIHMILVCDSSELNNTVGKLKGKSGFLFKKVRNIIDVFHLWGQKFHAEEIKSEAQLEKTINYVKFNREKHGLSFNKGIYPLVTTMTTPVEGLFTTTNKTTPGGAAVQLIS
jgi:REP element-mobilizing transposase RayT